MDMENSFIKMEDIMKVNGKIIKWMAGENFIMKAENLHIKAIGVKTNFMVLEKYIMITLFKFNVDLILPILISLKIIGSIMRECL